ncbi:MAG: hypothetical protein F6K11_16800 [Leptolyngbya sp. SIO3F4]|nr:hypothetical protein [Leptolyngbya sp. SIO3F4]
MKIFVAGTSGTIGHALISQLDKAVHGVTALSCRSQKLNSLQQMGATPALRGCF